MSASSRELEIFTAAQQLPAADRAAFLERACGGDAVLRQRVEVLLKAHGEAGDFLEAPPKTSATSLFGSERGGEKPGDWIGRYKLLQQIGEGGCGVVYLAEQEEPVRRRVALKVIKPGMDTRSVIARFEAERQALALMDHPNIAKVFDAGATESGRPYFVMELVRGIRITTYCDEHGLSTAERLKLFIQVCQAVQHAHLKGIIHRDLKPSNILVTTAENCAPSPVVIDFGIAKATTNQRLTDKTLFTAFEMLIGTPAYMSPEQAAITGVDVDTRTDIYSLGVLLYELLTGSTPFDSAQLVKAGLDEIRRVIREDEPVRPSSHLSRLTRSDLTTVAGKRHTEPPTLIRAIQGDLDWIALKSLEKDRTRRYETASSLAADIQHYLANETVSARPASAAYRFQKTVLRNKLLFGGITVLTVMLLVSFGLVSAALVKERQARRETEAALQQAKAGVEVAERQALRLRRRILVGERAPSNTDVLPMLDLTFAEAEAGFREALSVQRRILGVEHPAYVDSLESLGLVLYTELRHAEAERVLRQVLALRLKLSNGENAETATTRYALSRVLASQGKNAPAESEARQALELRRRLLGIGDEKVADALGAVVSALQGERKFAEAEQLLREYVTPAAIAQPAGGEFLMVRINYHARRQQWTEAASAAAEAVAARPADHRFYHMLAPLLVETGERARYEKLCQQILKEFGATTDAFVADRMAKDCLLLPSTELDLAVANKLAETALYEGKGSVALPYFQGCKALAEFRLGNFARAVEWANKARDSRYEDAKGMAYCVLAMAHAQLHETTEARSALAAATEILEKELPRRGADDLGSSWQGWIFAQELMQQAKALTQAARPVASVGQPATETAATKVPFAAGQPGAGLQ